MTVRRAVALLAAAALAGCGTAAPTPEQQHAELAARPRLAAAHADLDTMLGQIRDRLGADIRLTGWTAAHPGTTASCYGLGKFDDAKTLVTTAWTRSGPIPEATWPRALAVITEVTAQHGFAAPEQPVSRPGLHAVRATGPYDARFTLDAGDNVAMGATTGCHLDP